MEYIDIFDENNNPTRQVKKREKHMKKAISIEQHMFGL